MMQQYLQGLTLAVVGASGMVGKEMIKVLAKYGVPKDMVRAFASERSVGKQVWFNRASRARLRLELIDYDNLPQVDVALLAVDNPYSRKLAPLLAKQGTLVVDNSSEWRYHTNVPLVVPEVNAHAIEHWRITGIIANPNCVTAQLMMVMMPFQQTFGLDSMQVTSFQSVSGAGAPAVEEMRGQQRFKDAEGPLFPARIHANVIPLIGGLQDDGYSGEEVKIREESRKILRLPGLKVSATCVRVPVERGHGAVVNFRLKGPVELAAVKSVLEHSPTVEYVDDIRAATPLELIRSGDEGVRAYRVRADETQPKGCGYVLWCVGDNLGKGAALNAVQIAAEWNRFYR